MKRLAAAISALESDSFETRLFDWIDGAVASDNKTILLYPGDRPPRPLRLQAERPEVHENIETQYLAGAYLLDPFHALHADEAAPGLYTLGDVAPDQFHRTRYHAEYYARTTLVDEIVFATRPAPGLSVHVCLGRDATSGRRFSRREVAAARDIAPVLCALAHWHWQGQQPGELDRATLLHEALRDQVETTTGVALSPRQAEVALLILKGHSSLSIGLRLGISEQTVKVFRKQLYRKCRISSQAELFTLMMPLLSGAMDLAYSA